MKPVIAILAIVATLTVASAAAQPEESPHKNRSSAIYPHEGVTFISIEDTGGDPSRPGKPESLGRYLYGSVRITHRGDEFVPEPGRLCERWAWSPGGTPAAVSGSRSCYQSDMPAGCEESDGYELYHYLDSWTVRVENVVVYFSEEVYEWDLYCKGRFIHP